MIRFSDNAALRTSIITELNRFNRHPATDTGLTPAAVVIGICEHTNASSNSIFLTRRSNKLRNHAGQFALPGGKVDKHESIEDAALRELDEELNLKVDNAEILGMLDDFVTQSGFRITPVVVWIQDQTTMQANPDEVAAVYQIPLTDIAALEVIQGDENLDEPIRGLGKQSSSYASIYLPSIGTTIFSPTAAIIYQFSEVALLGRSTRVAHFAQPKFARR